LPLKGQRVLFLAKYKTDNVREWIGDFWRKVEIILLLTAFGLFAFAEYNRAYFIMLVLIHNRLLKDK
jgi:hypothetical protein